MRPEKVHTSGWSHAFLGESRRQKKPQEKDASERILSYLASPYTDDDPKVRRTRFEAACAVVGKLMTQGHVVFSPIGHSHCLIEAGGCPVGWEYWQTFDRAIIEISKVVVVLCLDGWKESVGVQAEIAIAREIGIPISFVDVNLVEIEP